MPVWDFFCDACGAKAERFVFLRERDHQVCSCGAKMDWGYAGRGPLMIPDTIPGGRIVENLDSRPTRYDSRTAIKDRMREKGVESYVRHKGSEGSDKSKFTQRWI